MRAEQRGHQLAQLRKNLGLPQAQVATGQGRVSAELKCVIIVCTIASRCIRMAGGPGAGPPAILTARSC